MAFWVVSGILGGWAVINVLYLVFREWMYRRRIRREWNAIHKSGSH